MVRLDDGGGGPTLNAKAKHFERELFKVFSVQTGSISMTQTDWQDARTQLENLATDVSAVRSQLEAPGDGSKGWTGPAAEAALATLKKLSDTLDGHAVKVGDVDVSLGQVYQAVTDAKSAWYAEVASISTYVNPEDHKRLPAPYAPTPENVRDNSIHDPAAAAAAEDALWEERNQAAKKVLEQLGNDTQTATAKMPIETKDDTATPYNNQGPATTNRTAGTATQSTSGGYPAGEGRGGLQIHHTGNDTDTDTGNDTDLTPVGPTHPTGPQDPTSIVCEGPVRPDFDPISSDGDVTGSTGVSSGTGQGGAPGSYPNGAGGAGGGGVGAGGVAAGGIGGAAGLGGLLRGRAGGGMLSTTGTARGGGSPAARANGAGARGSAGGPGGTARGGATMVPGGGGASARGGASGRGSAVKGATGSGRYGVPKLGGAGVVPAGGGQAGKSTGKAGGRAGGGRGSAAVGAAGGGGSRKGDKDGQPQDVDKLTHEDEETWYDGTEESSPQVWQ